MEIPEGFKMTELGPLPQEWRVEALGNIAEMKYGKSNPGDKGSTPVVGSGGVYSWTKRSLVDFPTIVIGRKGTAGKVWLFNKPCYPSDTTFYLEWKRDVEVRFIFNYMIFNPLSGEHAKTTLPSLQKSDLENFLIPYPPLPEQKKIAAVLSAVQEAKEKTEEVIKAAKELKKSLMKHLFTYGPVPVKEAEKVKLKETEIGMVPEEWEVVTVGNVYEFSRKPRDLLINETCEIPFIPMELISEDSKRVKAWRIKRYSEISSGTFVFKNDLIVAKITPCFENGKQAILEHLPTDYGYATTEVWALHPRNGEGSTEYLYNYLKILRIRANMASKMEGTTGRQRLPRHVLANLKIPLPRAEVQNRIVKSLSVVAEKIEAEENKRKALEELFKTLLNNLMTGKIRVKDLDIV